MTLTPIDIQQKEFRVSRFGGYKMRDVDEFLDQITDSFTALTAATTGLRAGAAPVVGTPDLGDVARQADEIIARAGPRPRASSRRPAATAATGSTASPDGPQERAAVTAFIAQEREFLQSLAGLVQEHAETVKGMAKSARSARGAGRGCPRQGSEAKAEPVTTAVGAIGPPRPDRPPEPRDPPRRRRTTPPGARERRACPRATTLSASSRSRRPRQPPEAKRTRGRSIPPRAVLGRGRPTLPGTGRGGPHLAAR